MSIIEGKNWCKVFDKPIEYQLIRLDKPPCIEENKGCGNCPYSTYKTFVDGKEISGDTFADSLNVVAQVFNEMRDQALKEMVQCL